jgi:hypothetical protein
MDNDRTAAGSIFHSIYWRYFTNSLVSTLDRLASSPTGRSALAELPDISAPYPYLLDFIG